MAGGHGCDAYDRLQIVYRKISDPSSVNKAKSVDLKSTSTNWTDIENAYENDTYELTLIVNNNEGLSAETIKHIFTAGTGWLIILFEIMS